MGENDKNIFYGGDFDLTLDYQNIGTFLIKFLKLGLDRDCLVNKKMIITRKHKLNILYRSMQIQEKFGLLRKS